MEDSNAPKSPTVIKYGLIISAALIVYFLILILLGLMRYSGLRTINYALIALGIYLAFKEIRRKRGRGNIGFLGGLGMGFMIVLISSVIYSLFVLIYGIFIDPAFINIIWKNPFSYNVVANTMALVVYVFSETFFFGFLINLIVSEAYKWGLPPESEEE